MSVVSALSVKCKPLWRETPNPDCPRRERMWGIALGCYQSSSCSGVATSHEILEITTDLGRHISYSVSHFYTAKKTLCAKEDIAMFWQFECRK